MVWLGILRYKPIFMRNILAKDLKIKFVEILNEAEEFSYENDNPFLMKLGNVEYFVFLKNISSAYFKKLPDITRVQLPLSSHFSKIVETEIPFVILGYDIDNDAYVCWNPFKIKDRLNAKSNVSLYSRESLQSQIKFNEFKEDYLSNGEKIILFDRENLLLFFEQLPHLFDVSEINQHKNKPKVSAELKPVLPQKLVQIEDNTLIARITPMLKKNRVLEAVEVCSNFYGDKYKSMSFKDWFKIVNDKYQNLNL